MNGSCGLRLGGKCLLVPPATAPKSQANQKPQKPFDPGCGLFESENECPGDELNLTPQVRIEGCATPGCASAAVSYDRDERTVDVDAGGRFGVDEGGSVNVLFINNLHAGDHAEYVCKFVDGVGPVVYYSHNIDTKDDSVGVGIGFGGEAGCHAIATGTIASSGSLN